MSQLLVLGEGWVGSAVASVAASRGEVTTLDPPIDPALRARDAAAADTLRAHIVDHGTTAVINACGRVRGDDDELTDANVSFPRWLCATLAELDVKLVHVGSASEYGDPGSADPVTEASPARPVGAYATTKAAGTDVVVQGRVAGKDYTVARVFNIVGRPVPPVSPMHGWLQDLRALPPSGGQVEVWWPPTTRDFVMIEDVAGALVDLASTDQTPEIVNVCSGVGIAFGEIVAAMADALGLSATIRSLERPGIEAVVGDPSLLDRTIGWIPEISAQALAERVTGGGDEADR